MAIGGHPHVGHGKDGVEQVGAVVVELERELLQFGIALHYEVVVDVGDRLGAAFFGDDDVDFAALKGIEEVADVEFAGAQRGGQFGYYVEGFAVEGFYFDGVFPSGGGALPFGVACH